MCTAQSVSEISCASKSCDFSNAQGRDARRHQVSDRVICARPKHSAGQDVSETSYVMKSCGFSFDATHGVSKTSGKCSPDMCTAQSVMETSNTLRSSDFSSTA